MASQLSSINLISDRYASALYELAIEANKVDVKCVKENQVSCRTVTSRNRGWGCVIVLCDNRVVYAKGGLGQWID